MLMNVMLGIAIVLIILSIGCSYQGIRGLKRGDEGGTKIWFRRAVILFAMAVVCYLLPMIPLIGWSLS